MADKKTSTSKEKKLAALGKMLHSKFKTFEAKVKYVRKRFIGIKKPEALVAASLNAAGLK